MSHWRISWPATPEGDMHVTSKGETRLRNGAMPPVGASTVWSWPETKAFLRRLGVNLNLPITSLTFKMDFEMDRCDTMVTAAAVDHSTWVKDLLNVEDAP